MHHILLSTSIAPTKAGVQPSSTDSVARRNDPCSHGGSIINVSSTAGIQGYPALPGYTAAKFGVRGLTKAVALDIGKHGIRVNPVHPGVIRTPMTSSIPEDTRHVAMDRTADPTEIANLVISLGSDESSFSTGAEFIVDGGETAGLVANPRWK